jgi:phosphomannomutase
VARAPKQLADVPIERISDQDGVKYILSDNSWLLIRPSGTEPVLRIYAESHSDTQVQRLLEAGAQMAEELLGARQFAANA